MTIVPVIVQASNNNAWEAVNGLLLEIDLDCTKVIEYSRSLAYIIPRTPNNDIIISRVEHDGWDGCMEYYREGSMAIGKDSCLPYDNEGVLPDLPSLDFFE
jgi:hypothetical protein